MKKRAVAIRKNIVNFCILAALVGVMRVYNSRHWPSDVLGGVGAALLTVSFTYWLYGK